MTNENLAPIAMVDDNVDDFVVAEIYYELAKAENPFLHLKSGAALLDYYAAVARGEKPPIALVLLDINMPRMNGFEVLEAMGQLAVEPPPTIVMLTTSARPEDKDRALALGARGFGVKPMEGAEYITLFDDLAARFL